MAFSVKAGVIWHQKINWLLLIDDLKNEDDNVFCITAMPFHFSCLTSPSVFLNIKVLQNATILCFLHDVLHTRLFLAFRSSVGCFSRCMLCMLYTVCSTYFSCLFVWWAANIPALLGFTRPLSPPSMPCSTWMATYGPLSSCATRKCFSSRDPCSSGGILKSTQQCHTI